MSYDQFKEFHEKHPDLDNSEYYKEFPETNQSTIRSWKNRARKPATPAPATPLPTPLPTKEEARDFQGYDDEMIKLLCTQTGTPYNEFEGVDNKSAILVLKAKMKNMQLQDKDKPSRAPNSSILPSPNPIGQNNAKFGIDEYINFNAELNEISMEIPMSKLMDPEENKRIRERIK